VETDVAFTDVLLDEVGGQAIDPRIGHARDVDLGWLDLDHLGSEIAQRAGRMRSTEHSSEFEHADAGQRPLGHAARVIATVTSLASCTTICRLSRVESSASCA